ncbi:hypothetical protein AN958_00605 [Leucoagaricus sp. SymC.cos]|nr:hypothetical protein AN958_00605 [Leucoagaricus sp. SymC.cos]
MRRNINSGSPSVRGDWRPGSGPPGSSTSRKASRGAVHHATISAARVDSTTGPPKSPPTFGTKSPTQLIPSSGPPYDETPGPEKRRKVEISSKNESPFSAFVRSRFSNTSIQGSPRKCPSIEATPSSDSNARASRPLRKNVPSSSRIAEQNIAASIPLRSSPQPPTCSHESFLSSSSNLSNESSAIYPVALPASKPRSLATRAPPSGTILTFSQRPSQHPPASFERPTITSTAPSITNTQEVNTSKPYNLMPSLPPQSTDLLPMHHGQGSFSSRPIRGISQARPSQSSLPPKSATWSDEPSSVPGNPRSRTVRQSLGRPNKSTPGPAWSYQHKRMQRPTIIRPPISRPQSVSVSTEVETSVKSTSPKMLVLAHSGTSLSRSTIRGVDNTTIEASSSGTVTASSSTAHPSPTPRSAIGERADLLPPPYTTPPSQSIFPSKTCSSSSPKLKAEPPEMPLSLTPKPLTRPVSPLDALPYSKKFSQQQPAPVLVCDDRKPVIEVKREEAATALSPGPSKPAPSPAYPSSSPTPTKVKFEPLETTHDFTLPSGPEKIEKTSSVFIKQEILDPSEGIVPLQKLVTESCSFYPIPDNCRNSAPGYQDNRIEFFRAKYKELQSLGLKKQRVIFRCVICLRLHR